MHRSYHPRNYEKVSEKTMPISNVVLHRKSSSVDLFLVPEEIFFNEGAKKRGVGAIQSGLLKMSEQEENMGADCLAHVSWGILDDICRHFRKSAFTRSSTSKIHGSGKCMSSGHHTGSHG